MRERRGRPRIGSSGDGEEGCTTASITIMTCAHATKERMAGVDKQRRLLYNIHVQKENAYFTRRYYIAPDRGYEDIAQKEEI